MRLKTRVEELESNTRVSFDGVSCDMDTISEELQSISNRLAELEDVYGEIATNGVVRDLRRLEKEHEVVMNAVQGLRGHVDDKFAELEQNGVATAVNKLNNEVFKSRKETKEDKEDSWYNYLMRVHYGVSTSKQEEPTLAGKVEAIIEHLGIDLSVKPAEKKEAKVVAKKVTKKKGKK